VLEHARGVLHEVEAAQALAHYRQAEPSGRLRVSMPADLATTVLEGMLADFLARHPKISLELDLSPRRVDLVGENFDLALRMGTLPDDATLAARRVAEFSIGLYASPGYLQQAGQPSEPEALMAHRALRLLRRSGEAENWLLRRGEQEWEGAPPAALVVNSPGLLLRLARLGSGIVAVADHFAEPWVESGELLPVLPEWSLPPDTAWAVFPGRRLMPARTRVFLEALQAHFEGPQCQAAQERVRRARFASTTATHHPAKG
jgi:DNA-binding transcriptional LysR family regulator